MNGYQLFTHRIRVYWNEDYLKLAIPFYDSFIYINNLSFGNAIPDFSFTKPTLFLEDNKLALDFLLTEKVKKFATNNNLQTTKVRSIY